MTLSKRSGQQFVDMCTLEMHTGGHLKMLRRSIREFLDRHSEPF